MGNCVAICTFKSAFTEAHAGLNEQPLHSVGEQNRNGRDVQRHRDRSRSSRSRKVETFSSSKPSGSCKNTGEGVVRVKVVIRKQELTKLLSNGLGKRAAMEDLLVELQAKLGDQSTAVYDPYEDNSCIATGLRSPHLK